MIPILGVAVLLAACPSAVLAVDTSSASYAQQRFDASAKAYVSVPNPASIYANGSDLVWKNDPRQWHQQAARIVCHRFSTFETF